MRNASRTTWPIALVGFAIVSSLVGCNSTQTVGEQLDDTRISTAVTAKLAADPEVNPFEIDVDTQDGVVRLSGMVETNTQRSEAEKLARNTDGVTRVINDIKLGDPTLAENIDDAWISTKIKAKIAADPDVNAFNIDVDVLQGVVTLSGEVKTAYAQRRAEEIASRTEGVRDVKNLIKVAAPTGR
jgi:hyperosmotically inducible protein